MSNISTIEEKFIDIYNKKLVQKDNKDLLNCYFNDPIFSKCINLIKDIIHSNSCNEALFLEFILDVLKTYSEQNLELKNLLYKNIK